MHSGIAPGAGVSARTNRQAGRGGPRDDSRVHTLADHGGGPAGVALMAAGPLTCGRAKSRVLSGASGRGIQWVGTMRITPADAPTQPKVMSYLPTTTEAAASVELWTRAHRSSLVPSRGAVSSDCQCMKLYRARSMLP